MLLEKIKVEKERLIREKKIKRGKVLPPIDQGEVSFELPDGWKTVRIDEVFFVSGGITKNPKRTPVENHFPYLGVANVQRGRLELDEVKRFELAEFEICLPPL